MSGHTDVGVNGIYSSDVAENWHTDLNVVTLICSSRGFCCANVRRSNMR